MIATLISLLLVAIPVAVFAAAIWVTSRHEVDAQSDFHRRYSPGLWLTQGRG